MPAARGPRATGLQSHILSSCPRTTEDIARCLKSHLWPHPLAAMVSPADVPEAADVSPEAKRKHRQEP